MTAPPDAVVRRADAGSTAAAAAASALVASCQEPERFAEVFDRYYVEIHGYAARRLGSDVADDVASDTFLTAFRQRARFDAERGDPRAWLYGIATNLIRRHRRQEIRAYRALTRVPATPLVDSHEERAVARVGALRVQGELAAALARLSAGDRDVLLLVALAGLTYDEVALALGIAYGTVCSRLSRARRRLREALGGIDPTGEVGHG
ncbi:RNA polymerase sigma factor [Actinopolymorpha alba]|uniref:RNA polymerase sigma factor n=1 Tax=Actinopolymorpha alba TaxID=533267 RepID=UPI0003781CD3|nr:RNA polymerase sigma factor [Actinopolymorpha alba]